MVEPVSITRTRPKAKSMDYALLVEEGIQYIQKWAASTWTDHNTHDSGITLLEALSFAMTELGYRGQLSIQELLDASLPLEDMAIYAPNDVLSCKPITVSDFQKILIAHPQIRYANFKTNTTGNLNGLYEVQVELETHPLLGDLNDSIVKQVNPIVVNGTSYIAEYAFPYWDEDEVINWKNPITLNSIAGLGNPTPVLVAFDEDEINDYFSNLQITSNTNQTTNLTAVIRVSPLLKDADKAVVEAAVVAELQSVAANSVIDVYRRKIEEANKVMQIVATLLSQNRNLCEDFASFKSIRTQEIAINAFIELTAGADAQQTLIEFFERLDLFIDPIAQYKDFQQLENEGLEMEAIFDGPFLSNGFLTDSSSSPNILYSSDLISEIMQVSKPSIIAIQNFSMNSYIRNRLKVSNAPDCIKVFKSEQFQPRLSVAKSNVTFYKEGIEIPYNLNDVIKEIEIRRNKALKAVVNSNGNLPDNKIKSVGWLPSEIANYHSVQYDLPLVYGTQSGLPDSASNIRKAQLKQLKAYLIFFEQILCSHAAQLANTNKLFDINFTNTEDARTYFYQSINDSIDLEDVLKSATNYKKTLESATQSHAQMLQRKSQLFDHLLGRFGEDLLELSQLQHLLDQRKLQKNIPLGADLFEEIQKQQINTNIYLLKAKSNFLKNICDAASQRAMGLKQSLTELSGFEKRLYLKLGIFRNKRVKFSVANPEVFCMVEHILLRNNPIPFNINISLPFEITLVFPSGYDTNFTTADTPTQHINSRFAEKEFRRYVEKTVIQECPAHIIPHIVWLDRNTNPVALVTTESFNNFENLYFAWLTRFESGTLNEPAGLGIRNNLMALIKKIID